ncbi:MAG TPA: hypothetical protein VGD79_10855 [Thermoanaerobaculia bacterium]|jgi:hypothetical protein
MKQHTTAYPIVALWLAVGLSLLSVVALLLVPLEFTDVRGAVVYSTTPRLRLRVAPVVNVDDTSNVVARLDPTHPLLVLDEQENAFGWWLYVRDEVTGQDGWAAANYLRATPVVRTVSRTVPFASVVGARVGSGVDRLQLFVRRASAELQVLFSFLSFLGTVISIAIAVIALRRVPQAVRVVIENPWPPPMPPITNTQPPPGPSRGRNGHYMGSIFIPKKK